MPMGEQGAAKAEAAGLTTSIRQVLENCRNDLVYLSREDAHRPLIGVLWEGEDFSPCSYIKPPMISYNLIGDEGFGFALSCSSSPNGDGVVCQHRLDRLAYLAFNCGRIVYGQRRDLLRQWCRCTYSDATARHIESCGLETSDATVMWWELVYRLAASDSCNLRAERIAENVIQLNDAALAAASVLDVLQTGTHGQVQWQDNDRVMVSTDCGTTRSSKPVKRRRGSKGVRCYILVEQAVRNYHKFEGGNVDNRIPPITGRELARQSNGAFSARTADRWFVARFGSKHGYSLACKDGSLGRRLAINGDDVRAFGTFDAVEREIGDDAQDDAEDRRVQKRPKIVRKF